MKVMILGSIDKNYADEYERVCTKIATVLANRKDTLVICSLFEDSVDYYVFKEFIKYSEDVQLHYFDTPEVNVQIEKVVKNNILKFSYLSNSNLDIKYSYLFCQINAMIVADVIVVIGGKIEGSASLLLLIAESNNKLVIPIISLGGAGKQYYDRNMYRIKDLLKDKFECIGSNDVEKIINSFLDNANKYSLKKNGVKHVFISYARDNPGWADQIELILRRRGISLFRDESDFKAGSNIPIKIQEEIFKADTFIAVWCKDYACSPWCMDEIEMALDRIDSINLWIICVDKTRIVPKRARDLLNYPVHNREELEGILLKLLSK